MTPLLAPLIGQINARRMRELLLDFADIPSPPHQTAIAAEWYAGCLRASGAAEVRLLRDWPQAPSVVAGFPGVRRAPILEINGHLDALPIGPARAYCTGTAIVGRGIVSGKAELIAAAEAARVLAGAGPLPGGGLLIVAHSRHELPDGDGIDLAAQIDRGIVGDAVLIAGGDHRVAPIAGLGLGLFRAVFSSLQEPGHERHRQPLATAAGANDPMLHYTPIDAAQAFATLLRRRQALFHRHPDPLIGAESVFVSHIEGGDCFDRVPSSCCVEGNWRWLPERQPSDVFHELQAMAQQAARLRNARVTLTLTPRRDAYRTDPETPIVQSLRRAYQQISGCPLPLGTSMYASAVPVFQYRAGIEAIAHGVDTATLRTAQESVSVEELVRVARTYLCLLVDYLTRSANRDRIVVDARSLPLQESQAARMDVYPRPEPEPRPRVYAEAHAVTVPVEAEH